MALVFQFFILISIHVSAQPEASENACLRCHGNSPPKFTSSKKAPLFPVNYSMSWNMYEVNSTESPPFDKIPNEYLVTHGETHYDWIEKKMVEVYYDQCINIFSLGNNFSCKFISVKNKTYLIKFPIGQLKSPKSCCLWSKGDFWAPRPDVLHNFSFQKKSRYSNNVVNWWIYDIPLPGPFGYGTKDESGEPVAFWFPVIGAWVQQNFSEYKIEKPNPKEFVLPSLCQGQVPVCEQ